MSLTAQDVAEIIRLLDQSEFDSLDLEMGDLRLRLRRSGDGRILADREEEPGLARPERNRGAHPRESALHRPPAAPVTPAADESAEDGLVDVPSPLLGIFYRAPKPGAAPFVEVGQSVEEDTIIGIIEVMKLMNSIRAGTSGLVTEIPAANGALVEYGEPLIRVRPGG